MIRRIERGQVRIGMFICGFGGSWFLHPFWRSKFLIETGSDVEKIHASGVSHVLIDDERGVSPESGDSDQTRRQRHPPGKIAPPRAVAWRAPCPTGITPERHESSIARRRNALSRSKQAW
jgi:hypothetical protein